MAYSQTNLFIRSCIFSVLSITMIVFFSILIMCTFPLPIKYRHTFIRGCLRFYLSVLECVCHIGYEVEGLENIAGMKSGIVLSKHQSTWETFFLPLIFHNPAVIAKRELLWIPFFGWALSVAAPITINRNNKSSAMQQVINKGKKFLEKGRWIILFPEGTRVATGVVGHYKMGGARLAVATGYPVIPVALNTGRYWPRRKFIKQPGTIKVVIGPPIESQGRSAEEVLDLAKTWIESTMLRIDGLVDKSTR